MVEVMRQPKSHLEKQRVGLAGVDGACICLTVRADTKTGWPLGFARLLSAFFACYSEP